MPSLWKELTPWLVIHSDNVVPSVFTFLCNLKSNNKELESCAVLYESDHAKTCLTPYANNKGADQFAHPRSLISTFVVRCLDSMICIRAISKVSRF